MLPQTWEFKLVDRNVREVTEEECLRVSSDPNEFLRMIGRNPQDEESEPKRPLQAVGGKR
jgi:hypothetical protein